MPVLEVQTHFSEVLSAPLRLKNKPQRRKEIARGKCLKFDTCI